MTETRAVEDNRVRASRRRFLRDSAAIGGTVLAGDLVVGEAQAADSNNLPPNVPEWMKVPGDAMGSQLYGTPSPFEKDVVKNIPKNLKQYISASGGRRCRISTVSSPRTGCSTSAIMAAFPPSIRRSTG